jgi:hypothetical protein
VVAVVVLVSKVVADSMTIILMDMDLRLEDQVGTVALQEEALVVQVVVQVTAHKEEDLEAVAVAAVGIVGTSNAKVLVGTKTGMQNGLDINLRCSGCGRRREFTKGDCVCGSMLWRVWACRLFIAFYLVCVVFVA